MGRTSSARATPNGLSLFLNVSPEVSSHLPDATYGPQADGPQLLSGPIDTRPLHHTPTSALLALSPNLLSPVYTRQLTLVLPPTWRI
jgi:hypothetical protein